MNIDPLSNLNNLSLSNARKASPQRPVQAEKTQEAPGSGVSAVDRHQELVKKLADLPEIRPEAVERGKQLVADPEFPSAAVVDRVAELLAELSEDSE